MVIRVVCDKLFRVTLIQPNDPDRLLKGMTQEAHLHLNNITSGEVPSLKYADFNHLNNGMN